MPATQSSYLRWLLGVGTAYILLIWGLALWDFAGELQKILAVWGFAEDFQNTLIEPKGFRDHLYLEFIIAFVASAIITLLLLVSHRLPSSFVFIAILGISVCISFVVWGFVSEFKDASTFPQNTKITSYHGLILAFVASAIITLLLLVNHRRPSDSTVVNAIFLVFVSVLFAFLFSSPIVNIKEIKEMKCYNKSEIAPAVDDITKGLITSEHQKAIEEIKQRIEINDGWFHKKFLLIGGILAAFLAFASQSLSKERGSLITEPAEDMFKTVKKMFETILPSSVLGIGCVVSLAIDLHIRSNTKVTIQLGLWIKNCVETILNRHSDVYMGWETFLRMRPKDGGMHESFTGMHMDFLFNLLVGYISVFVLLYVMYVASVFFCFSQRKLREGEFGVSLFIFALVHVFLAIFAFAGNSFPSMFQVQLPLWPGRWFSGENAGYLPLLLCLLVSYLTFTRLFTLYKGSPEA